MAFRTGRRNGFVNGPHRLRRAEKRCHCLLRKGFALAPNEKYVPLEYALGLLALGDFRYREKARELLTRSISLPAKDAYEWILHAKAVETLDSLNESDDDDDDD